MRGSYRRHANRTPLNMAHPPRLMESLKRTTSTLLDIVHTRMELLAYEFEAERLHVGQMLLLGSIILFWVGLGILLCTVLIVVISWDSHRELVLATLAVCCFMFGLYFVLSSSWNKKTPLKIQRCFLFKKRIGQLEFTQVPITL